MADINLTGGFYVHPSQNTNYQRCMNLVPFMPGDMGRGADSNPQKPTLLQRGGKQLLIDLGVSTIRGILAVNNTIFVVGDNKFYKVVVDVSTQEAVATQLGIISNYTGLVSMSANSGQVIILSGTSQGWIYSYLTFGTVTLGTIGGTSGNTYSLTINGTPIYTSQSVTSALAESTLITQINLSTHTTGVTASSPGTGILTLTNKDNTDITVVESGVGFLQGTNGITVAGGDFSSGVATAFQLISDPNFLGGQVVTYMDGYFIYSPLNTQQMYASQLQDGTSWDALDLATAEYQNNPIVGMACKNRNMWVFCSTCVEPWYDAANAEGFPFSERTSTELNIGCLAPFSIVNLNSAFVWLDNRKFIVISIPSPLLINATSGNDAQIISTDAIHNEINSYPTISDAIGTSFYERGHLYYQITFPTAQKTWVYDMNTQFWHERGYFNTGTNTFQADLSVFYCQVDKLAISAGIVSGKLYLNDPSYYTDNGQDIRCVRTTSDLNNNFRMMGIDRLEIKCNTGNTPPTGDSSVPYISMRYSNDDGHTWSYEQSRELGNIGEYGKRIQWNRLGSSFQWLFEFVIVAAINFALISGTADIEEVEDY